MCSQFTTGELLFWKKNIVGLNSRRVFETKPITRVVYSDASASGCGGYIVELQGQTSYRTWCGNERARSSTFLLFSRH